MLEREGGMLKGGREEEKIIKEHAGEHKPGVHSYRI